MRYKFTLIAAAALLMAMPAFAAKKQAVPVPKPRPVACHPTFTEQRAVVDAQGRHQVELNPEQRATFLKNVSAGQSIAAAHVWAVSRDDGAVIVALVDDDDCMTGAIKLESVDVFLQLLGEGPPA